MPAQHASVSKFVTLYWSLLTFSFSECLVMALIGGGSRRILLLVSLCFVGTSFLLRINVIASLLMWPASHLGIEFDEKKRYFFSFVLESPFFISVLIGLFIYVRTIADVFVLSPEATFPYYLIKVFFFLAFFRLGCFFLALRLAQRLSSQSPKVYW